MTEETFNPSTINLRSKGLASNTGRVHRGCVKDATTKLSIGSIPSTYESIIYKTDNKRAFGSSEKRFYLKEAASTLAGNSQQPSIFDTLPVQNKTNHNKQGLNAFVSKQKRQWYRTIRTPGPAHYQRQKNSSVQIEPRKCVTRQTRKYYRNYRKQNSEQLKELPSPGPGEYIYDKPQFWNTTYKGWKSSFQTKLTRDTYIQESISPGPGCYDMDPSKKTKRVEKKQNQNKENTNIIHEHINKNAHEQPGPGSYSQDVPTFKPLYQRIKMSGNFMAPVFVGKKRNRANPGPTAYLVKRMYDNIQPKLIQSTCFMSEVKRQIFDKNEKLGPNPVSPNLVPHKNFHFNIKNDWVC